MNLPRLIPFAVLLAAPACFAQLPPSILQPGRPVVPAVPNVPVVPALPSVPAGGSPAAVPSSTVPNTLSTEEVAQGWKLLFDGKRLIGMKGLNRTDPLSSGWTIQDGELNLPKDVKDMERMTGGDLVTMDFFWDFDFRFEFKMSASANSGVRYMLVENFGQVPVGLEYQILDDVHNSIGLKGGRLRRTGSLDAIYPVGENAKLRTGDPLNKTGDPWNEGRIVVQGTHVEHWLNGEKVLEYELGPQIRKIAVAYRTQEKPRDLMHEVLPATYGMKSRTRLSIADQGYEVAFRNLKVLQLAPQAIVIPGGGATRPGGTVPNPLLLPRGR
ncbi:MAG: DUF1080 domain-containing protein [Chthoniobacteraceae bacterium]